MQKPMNRNAPAASIHHPSMGRPGGTAFPPLQHLPGLASPSQKLTTRANPPVTIGPRGPRLLRTFSPLAPGDPVAVPGSSPHLNVIETDVNYTAAQGDGVIIVQGSFTITLNSTFTIVGFPVQIVADSGTVTVNGPIQNGPISIPQGTTAYFSFSPLSGTYSVLLGSSSPATFGFPYQEIATSAVVPLENTFAEVTTNATAIVTIGAGLHCITVKDATPITGVVTIPITAASGALLEDPNNLNTPGDYAATVYLKEVGGAVTFRWNGTMYKVAAST